ncbi:hypothetical protein Tco_0221075 [Tanacetum coccineum]
MNTSYPLSEQKVNNSIIFVLFVINFANMAPLPPREQRHPFLRYRGLEYTEKDITDFEEMLERIYSHEIHRVQSGLRKVVGTRGPLVWELILEFLSTIRFGEVLLDLDALGTIQFQLGEARRRLSWRQFILALGLHTGEEMKSLGFARDLMLRLCHQMMAYSIAGRSQAPKKVTVTDLFYLKRLDVGSVNIPYLLARYLRRFAAGRKSGAHISEGQFVTRFAEHFGILTAWVAMGPERQLDDVVGAPVVAEDAPAVDEGDQAVLVPVQAPQQLPSTPLAAARTVPQRLGRL